MTEPIIKSMLDDDLYKLTMMQEVFLQYGDLDVAYSFFNRGKTCFPEGFAEKLRRQVDMLGDLKLTNDEFYWLREKTPFIKSNFLSFFKNFRLDPGQVQIRQTDAKSDNLNIDIKGKGYETILWEVKTMGVITELYFQDMISPDKAKTIALKNLMPKILIALKHQFPFADFGTRRRFAYYIHDIIVKELSKTQNINFVGTSNMHLAMKYGISPIGTHAHEWFMIHQALFGTRIANLRAIEAWQRGYHGQLGTALTDTFTTDLFLKYFDSYYARLFDGVRHDSGNPFEYGDKIINHYKKLGIDPMSKVIIFSDGLNFEIIQELTKYFKNRIKISFGIGTNLTNDLGFNPLNMVIKMTMCNGIDVTKISDSPGKHTGKPEAIQHALYEIKQGMNSLFA